MLALKPATDCRPLIQRISGGLYPELINSKLFLLFILNFECVNFEFKNGQSPTKIYPN
uniref:Uncharacterized protein n=1 Tax=Nostoc flagelliforme str. Sunitezuoqi TaxID=676037 RepID=E7DPS1_9NOSO|nr:hypothetical protein Nfla_4003 [Nostoc flagelliforme str. Sunitezuoqi]